VAETIRQVPATWLIARASDSLSLAVALRASASKPAISVGREKDQPLSARSIHREARVLYSIFIGNLLKG